MTEKRPFRMVLPKKGRLGDDFSRIVDAQNMEILRASPRHDFGSLADRARDADSCEVLMQRPEDAFRSLLDGVADIAVAGYDRVFEFNSAAINSGDVAPLAVISNLGISSCRLAIAVPFADKARNPADMQGRRIATAYPETVRRWAAENNIRDVSVVARDGGVEDCVRLGLADAVCDMVQTGETLEACGLRPVMTLFESEAVMVATAGREFVAMPPVAARLMALSI